MVPALARAAMEMASFPWQCAAMTQHPFAAIILAAGQGTRMKSDLHKVLHPVAGMPMLHHLIGRVKALGAERTVVVVGALSDQVEASVAGMGVAIAHQAAQLGTGHAVAQAEQALAGFEGIVLILYGDVPLIQTETMARMVEALEANPDLRAIVLGFRPEAPGAYGRIVATPDGLVEKMVEAKDASPEELEVRMCNTGMMAVRAPGIFDLLRRIGNDNAAGEYYLPDIVMLPGQRSGYTEAASWEAMGVNNRVELAAVEKVWQADRRWRAQVDGVTLTDPESVFFAADTVLGRDVTIGPNVVLGPGVSIADGATIHAFSHIAGATIGEGAEVGPFARLRPGTMLGAKAKIGNFVEIKKAVLGAGAKANHLSYIGDAQVGAAANIGAGTITCNYDGFFKYRTEIGAGAFIGSNSALVAPVKIGAGAMVGAGSVVTKDVAADALAVARGTQVEKPGFARKFREIMTARKKKSGA
jgi:bifunctional UDP-N-acetylglucosamine pyrophosphorylase/glucosamine-1-phosphate N-acetyltransferase